MIALALALLLAQPILDLERSPAINDDPGAGPPDLRLSSDAFDVVRSHACGRWNDKRQSVAFDKRYGARLAVLRQDLTSIFGSEAMNRDIIRIDDPSFHRGCSEHPTRGLSEPFLRNADAFDEELSIWERWAADRKAH